MKPYVCVDCRKPLPDGGTWCITCKEKQAAIDLEVKREFQRLRQMVTKKAVTQ